MTATPERGMLRDDLLTGVAVAVACTAAPDSEFAHAVTHACTDAGARIIQWLVPEADSPPTGWVDADVLVSDAAGFHARALRDGPGQDLAALRACLDTTWRATRTLAGATDPAQARPRRVISIAPRPGAGGHAEAARAALENLARTLSVEWARLGTTVMTLAPGNHTRASELGALAAYLASPAGAYFSGCQLDLRGPPPVHRRDGFSDETAVGAAGHPRAARTLGHPD